MVLNGLIRPPRSSSCAHLPSSRTFSQCSLPGGIPGPPESGEWYTGILGKVGGEISWGKWCFSQFLSCFPPKRCFFCFVWPWNGVFFWVTFTVQFVEMRWNDIIHPEGRKLLWRPLAAQSCTTSCGHDHWSGTQFPVPASSTNRIQ